jgi:hypothetical protein
VLPRWVTPSARLPGGLGLWRDRSAAELDLRDGALTHRLGICAYPSEQLDQALAIALSDPLEHFNRRCVHGRQHVIEHSPGLIGDVDEQFATVVGMRLTAHEPTAFQRVEQRGDAPAGLDESLRDDLRRQRFTGAFDDRESLPGTRRQIADRPPPPRCFALAQRRGVKRPARGRQVQQRRQWKEPTSSGQSASEAVRADPVPLRPARRGAPAKAAPRADRCRRR